VFIQNIKNGSGGCNLGSLLESVEMHSGGAVLYNSRNDGNVNFEYCMFYKNRNDNGNCSGSLFLSFCNIYC
jgi:hypothetical protein